MAPDALLTRLAGELDAFARCLDGDLTEPVVHCGDWTLYELANHLGHGNQWVAAAVTEHRNDFFGQGAPEDRSEVAEWFRGTAHTLVETLSADPSTPAWTYVPLKTVGFWRRRCCHDTMIFRWDAENALGKPPVFDSEWAADGVAEVFDTLLPSLVSVGRLSEPDNALRITATDTGATWTLGQREPIAEVRATANDLLLGLWHRMSFADPDFSWTGDQNAAQAMLYPILGALGQSTKRCPEHEQDNQAKGCPHSRAARNP